MTDSVPSCEDGEISPETREALEDAFLNWYGKNFNILADGGTGDVYALLLALKASC